MHRRGSNFVGSSLYRRLGDSGRTLDKPRDIWNSFQTHGHVSCLCRTDNSNSLYCLLAAWHTLAQPQAKVWTLSTWSLAGSSLLLQAQPTLFKSSSSSPGYSGNYLWLEALAFADDESIIWGLNYIGWLFLGVSKALLIGALGSSPRERLLKILLGVYFSATLLMVVGYALRNLFLQLPIIVCWFIIQPLIFLLLGRYFSRLKS